MIRRPSGNATTGGPGSAAVEHDLIVVGGGTAGLGAARAARWAGADVVMVADGAPGGDCTFTGCVPSKTLIAAARVGLGPTDAFARVHETVDHIAATETADVLRDEGIDVVEGRGRLAGAGEVVVDGRVLRGRRVILATGAGPARPSIPGLDGIDALTTDTLFEPSFDPVGMGSIGIVGAGPAGCELAQALARLGVDVSLFEVARRVLPGEEAAASAVVAGALRGSGVDVHVGHGVERVAATAGGIEVVAGDESRVVDRVLVAAGRRPATDGLGLEDAGVVVDEQGFIRVDDRLATSLDGVYAVGDVTGVSALTPAADEMGRLAVGNALRTGLRGRFRAGWIPQTVFTDPEVARVGMTESEAARHGGRVAELPLTELDRAVIDGHTDGYVKLIAGPRRVVRHLAGGRILGATIVAPRAGEMIHEAVLAMRTRMFTGRLAQVSHAYPTWSHGIQKAAAQFFGEIEGRRARPARISG